MLRSLIWSVCFCAAVLVGVASAGEPLQRREADALQRVDRMLEIGVWHEAVVALEDHLVRHPDDFAARYDLAHTFFRLGKYDEAVREAVAVPADDVEYGRRREHLLMRLRFYAAREVDWSDPVAVLSFARLCNSMASYERAARAYRHLLSLRDTPEMRREYAEMLMWAGDHDNAIRQWRRYLDAVPDDVAARHELARSYIGRGRLDAAEKELHRTLELQSDNKAAILDLARVFIWRDEMERAERILSALHALRYEPVETGLLRAEMYLRLNRVEEAHAVLQDVLIHFPDETRVLLMLRELESSRRVEIAQLRRRLEEDPGRGADRMRLVDTLMDIGRPGAALREKKKLAMQRPDDVLLRERIRRLESQQRKQVEELMSRVSRRVSLSSELTPATLEEWISRHPGDEGALRRFGALLWREDTGTAIPEP